MAPRTLIGAGIGAGVGALGGAGLGALSTKDSKKKKGRAIAGGVLGGLAGAVGGGALHGGLRTKALYQGGHVPSEGFINRLGGHKMDPAQKKVVRGAASAGEGFFGSKSVKDIGSSDRYFGAKTKKEVKDRFRSAAKKLHPDKQGGDATAFKAAKQRMDTHMSFRFPEKKASALFFAAFYDELVKLGAKNPVSLKVPKPGTNLKGMERYTANPGKTPITAPGKATGSAATTSGLRHSTQIGRSGTSANPTPPPPSVTS
jgi:hypothetical protein